MPYFVYIIENLKTGIYYKGQSEDYLKRLEQHNIGESKYTSNGKWIWFTSKSMKPEEKPPFGIVS